MAKVHCRTSAGLKKIQIHLSIRSILVVSSLVMGCTLTGQNKWCASVLMRGRTQQCRYGTDMKNDNRHNRTIKYNRKLLVTVVFMIRDWKADIIPAGLPYCVVVGVLNRRLLPPLFYASNIVLRSLQWRLPPSLITTESICRWFFPFYPLFLCSSLSVPALSVCCGGFLFPIQHQTTISTGSWAAQ